MNCFRISSVWPLYGFTHGDECRPKGVSPQLEELRSSRWSKHVSSFKLRRYCLLATFISVRKQVTLPTRKPCVKRNSKAIHLISELFRQFLRTRIVGTILVHTQLDNRGTYQNCMNNVCTVPARGGRSCEHFGGYKTINRIPFTYKRTVRASFDDLNWAPNKTTDLIGAKAGHSFKPTQARQWLAYYF